MGRVEWHHRPVTFRATLLDDVSFEITSRDADALTVAAPLVTPGARIHLTALGGEDPTARLATAASALRAGLTPVAHLAARRLTGEQELRSTLQALADQGASSHLVAVGGDPRMPAGPYASALDLIRTGLLAEHGAEDVAVGGYPDGHPAIATPTLWQALVDKAAALTEQGIEATVLTQFSFDADAVVDWIAELRGRGVTAPVRVGVPGPTNAKRLLAFAKRCGVATGAGVVRKYGLSLGNLLATAGPDAFVDELGARLDPGVHGNVHLHLFAFGGPEASAQWARDYAR